MNTPRKHFLPLFGWLAGLLCLVAHPGQATDPPPPQIEAAFDLQPLEAALRQGPRNVTLRAILVIVDAIPGDGIAKSVRVDMGAYTRLLNILETREILKVERTVLQGSKATLANVRQALRNSKPGPDDVFLFFFSGHGGMEGGNRTFLQCHDKRLLYRSELINLVGQLPARLKLVISDACSDAVDGVAPTVALTGARSGGVNPANDVLYKQLFLNFRGTANISSSTQGQIAWSTDEEGGFFTHYFVKEQLIKRPIANWQALFNLARERTIQMFNKFPAKDRRSLAQKGINSQTPKAYALPLNPNGETVASNATTANDDLVDLKTGQVRSKSAGAKAPITITNLSGTSLAFAIDNNDNAGQWSEANLAVKNMGPDAKSGINQTLATVFFRDKEEAYSYDLEPGNYFFALNYFDELDLFAEEEGLSPQEIARPDLTKFLGSGAWLWEDSEGTEIKTVLRPDGSFTDTYLDDNTTETGQWAFTKETVDGENYLVLHLFLKNGAGEFDISYAIEVEEGGHCVQLIYLGSAENGKEIPYEEMEEDPNFNPVLIMYRE